MNPSLLKCWCSVVVLVLIRAASAQNQPVITTKSLPIGTTGVPYSAAISATSGAEPYTWSIRSGKLPSGLKLDPATGVVSGVPSLAAIAPANGSKLSTFSPLPLILQVQDSGGHTAIANLPINVANPIVIQTTSLPIGTVGVTYSFCLTATGGSLADNGGLWGLTGGMLPKQIILSQGHGCHGLLAGIPSKAGSFPIRIRVADFQGRSAQVSLVLRVAK